MDASYKWKVLETTELFKSGIFRMRKDRCELGDGRIMPNYYVLEFPDWVQVLPVTKDGKIILVKQYRHATGDVHIEIPGGSTSGSRQEEPLKAALRELEEETGYTSNDVHFLAKHRPNPALQDNFMHVYLAYSCEKTAEQQLDPFEEIDVFSASIDEVYEMIVKGKITHSIVLASFLLAIPELQRRFGAILTLNL